MQKSNITLSELLNSVEAKLGPERTLELIKNLGAHPTPLDSGAPPELGPPSQTSRVVVIGGGVAGLVLTYELAQRGIDVELWEASSRLGAHGSSARVGRSAKSLILSYYPPSEAQGSQGPHPTRQHLDPKC